MMPPVVIEIRRGGILLQTAASAQATAGSLPPPNRLSLLAGLAVRRMEALGLRIGLGQVLAALGLAVPLVRRAVIRPGRLVHPHHAGAATRSRRPGGGGFRGLGGGRRSRGGRRRTGWRGSRWRRSRGAASGGRGAIPRLDALVAGARALPGRAGIVTAVLAPRGRTHRGPRRRLSKADRRQGECRGERGNSD